MQKELALGGGVSLVTSAVVYWFLVTNQLIVTPAMMDTMRQEMRAQNGEKFVSKEDYRSDMKELKDVLKEIQKDIKELARRG